MPRPTKPIKDPVLKEWLTEFKSKKTKQCYLSCLRKFKQNVGIESLDYYIKNTQDATEDLKRFLISMDGTPSKSIHANISAVRSFIKDHDISFSENGWKKLKRRGFMPKRIMAETRDKKLTKTQLKKILNYLDIKAKAQVLFLLSSGCRVGESVQLKTYDLDLESDPPRAFIRAEYTKNGVGARTVFMSYEARDTIKDWLKIKDTIKKRNGKPFKKDMVFDWAINTARYMWDRAIEKAGLDIKDEKTHCRIYHLHGLRKFFRSQIGLDVDFTHALMGHSAYLDESYLRLNEKEIAEAYLEAMPNVKVYGGANLEIAKELEEKTSEIEALKEKVKAIEASERSVSQIEAEVSRLNEFITKRLSPLVSWAENEGYKIEDFSSITDETPERWRKTRKESNRGGLKSG